MIYFSLQVEQSGKAVCSLCQKTINYASRGVVAMIEHCQTKAHIEKVITKRTNYSLPTTAYLQMLMDYTRCLLASCPHRKLRRANQMSHYATE